MRLIIPDAAIERADAQYGVAGGANFGPTVVIVNSTFARLTSAIWYANGNVSNCLFLDCVAAINNYALIDGFPAEER